ncbi:CCA tRNA nucleotidyltransferase [Anaeromyxobacter oryzae]|uniref:HDIG domain-containing protein n=1 Tax=Anaeromyxobacter oryzae TaxID=2918170 RepID=A0ABN6N399_9BACT|nr:tRNA cytidylyltransferase [Anaeromyxobacter oryzae]BDG06328.1 HDIG domain-containing protein [Anaeromyxobacter oryzae]
MAAPAALARAAFPAPILDVLRRLGEAGHRSWLVGGAVRDLLLHRARDAADYDVATPATPEQVIALFRRVVPTGIAHGTVTVLVGDEKIEVTTFRGEGVYLDGRRPASVTFHTDLEADLARRDFTMNAMAFDPLARDFRDPFGGREDMRRGRVRAVGVPEERFGEDGLRPMRAVRFAAQLGYDLDPGTRAAIPAALDVVRKVAVERIATELEKLVVAPDAARGVALLRSTGLLAVVVPSLAALSAASVRHAEALLRRLPADAVLRFAALFHGLGADPAQRLLVELRYPRRLSDEVGALLRNHACREGDAAGAFPAGGAAELRRWLSRVTPPRVDAQLQLLWAEARALPARRRAAAEREVKKLQAAARGMLAESPPLSTQALALDGRAVVALLGVDPGPHVGEALRHLLDRVLEDPAANTAGALEAELRRWWAERTARL